MDPSDIFDQALALCELNCAGKCHLNTATLYLRTCRRLLSACTSVADPVAWHCTVVICLLIQVQSRVRGMFRDLGWRKKMKLKERKKKKKGKKNRKEWWEI
ncbi:hypothetical protein M5K25_026862 [Dendrobium thyrsiflorum]|uniref:Uncharacterized protein n=1 Tax=Dendrobium thyrsiflorum TaxID=117978 RepID=A0ABD0TYD8_DENTH